MNSLPKGGSYASSKKLKGQLLLFRAKGLVTITLIQSKGYRVISSIDSQMMEKKSKPERILLVVVGRNEKEVLDNA